VGYTTTPLYPSGAGGGGVFVLRYPNSYALATTTTGTSVNVINSSGYIYYVFTQSGSITF
jgi:hypothetical protein